MSIFVKRTWRCDVCGNRVPENELPNRNGGKFEVCWYRVALHEPGEYIGKLRMAEHFDTCSHECRKELYARMAECDVPNEPWVER